MTLVQLGGLYCRGGQGASVWFAVTVHSSPSNMAKESELCRQGARMSGAAFVPVLHGRRPVVLHGRKSAACTHYPRRVPSLVQPTSLLGSPHARGRGPNLGRAMRTEEASLAPGSVLFPAGSRPVPGLAGPVRAQSETQRSAH